MSTELILNKDHPVYKDGDVLLKGVTNLRLQLMEAANKDISAPEDIQSLLNLARNVTDKIEIALVRALDLKRRAESELAYATAEVEEAEIEAAGSVRKDTGLYGTAKEKAVGFSLHTLEQRRAERIARDTYRQACHLVEVLRLLHKGVDQTRQDVATRLRAITLTSSLERG